MSEAVFYAGPMGSGKSEALIVLYEKLTKMVGREKVLVVKPSVDTRQATVRSETGREIPALAVQVAEQIAQLVAKHKPEAIIADELHMLMRAPNGGGGAAFATLLHLLKFLSVDFYGAYLDIGHHGHVQEPHPTVMRLQADGLARYIHLRAECSEHGSMCPDGGATHSWLCLDLEHAIPGHLRSARHPDGVYDALCGPVFAHRMKKRVEARFDGKGSVKAQPSQLARERDSVARFFDGFRTQDSGKREQFATGSQRDSREGNGRFDLIPPGPLRRLAQLYERGARKYSEENWKKGQPLRRYLDSAMRHLMDYAEGKTEEDHLAAVAWNAFSLMWTQRAIREGKLPPELDDLGVRLGDARPTAP